MSSWARFCSDTTPATYQCLRVGSPVRGDKRTHVAEDSGGELALLANDAFHPRLRSHKLKGEFADSWACSVGYDLRIVLQFVRLEGSEAVLLETVGTHDEVY